MRAADAMRAGAGLWRRGGSAAQPRPLTALDCQQILRRLGWEDGGAGPNYTCVYLSKGDHRITLLTLQGDPVTPNGLRALIEDYQAADFSAGRRCVAVHEHGVTPAVTAMAAPHDITLIHVNQLERLEDALAEAAAAAARSRDAEQAALMKVYDPPVPAPVQHNPEAAGSGPRLETEAVAVFFRDRGGDDLLVTFANQWLRHDGRAFWGDSLAGSLGMSVVGFVAKEPNWFPPDDMLALLPAVRALLGGRFARRVCFGHSQGGYAAIKFSAALNASLVLAFSPQYAIDRRIVADDRVNKHYTGRLHAGMAVTADDTAGRIFLFYDRDDRADTQHAACIAAVTACDTIRLRHVGHASDRGMNRPEFAAGLLDAAWSGDADMVRRFMAQNRAVRVERAVLMALGLAATRPALAAAIMQHHGRGWKPDQISGVCFRLAKAGAAELAIAPALRAAEAAPGSANAQGTAGLIALDLRRMDDAFRLIERALALEPHSPKWRNAMQRVHSLTMAESAARASAPSNGDARALFAVR